MTRMLVCGDRKWLTYYLPDGKLDHAKIALVKAATFSLLDGIAAYLNVDVLIEGCAPGADHASELWSENVGIDVIREHLHFPAEWDRYGRSAGPIRNQKMLDEGRPDYVVALHDNLDQSRGTGHMVKIATKAGVPVFHFTTSVMGIE